MELTDGTTTTSEVIARPLQTADRLPVMLILPLTSISGAKTISLKIRQTGTGATTVGVSEIRMVAIRNDRFADVHSTTLGTTSSGTQSTYTTVLSQTWTPGANDYLTGASWLFGSSDKCCLCIHAVSRRRDYV